MLTLQTTSSVDCKRRTKFEPAIPAKRPEDVPALSGRIPEEGYKRLQKGSTAGLLRLENIAERLFQSAGLRQWVAFVWPGDTAARTVVDRSGSRLRISFGYRRFLAERSLGEVLLF